MAQNGKMPPGKPGVPPHWAPSSKDGVGTALAPNSRLWFTIHSGIVTETFFPMIDRAAIRDFGLLVADGKSFFSEEKSDTEHEIAPLGAGIPGWTVTNTCKDGRYRIEKTILIDPRQPTLLVRTRFEPLEGQLSDYKLYALLAPHLGNEGADNSGHALEEEGIPALVAEGAHTGTSLALCSSSPFTARSVGYVGTSDGWQDVHAHCRLTEEYHHADNGNIALTGEIDPATCHGEFLLSVGFGTNKNEAMSRALSGVREDFEALAKTYTSEWEEFQNRLDALGGPEHGDFGRMCAAVLQAHDAKKHAGGIIASLSIPWGEARGDSTLGGYHVVWPRDQVEAALALLAAGDDKSARGTLQFLQQTQQDDGHWYQNM